MFSLDDNLLVELGLGALPKEEKNKILQQIYETLELRVGTRLAEQMSDAQLDEFEGFIDRNDQNGALSWLETNIPHYRNVVGEELDKLKQEIRQFAPNILASLNIDPNAPIIVDDTPMQNSSANFGQPATTQYPDNQSINNTDYTAQQQPSYPVSGQVPPIPSPAPVTPAENYTTPYANNSDNSNTGVAPQASQQPYGSVSDMSYNNQTEYQPAMLHNSPTNYIPGMDNNFGQPATVADDSGTINLHDSQNQFAAQDPVLDINNNVSTQPQPNLSSPTSQPLPSSIDYNIPLNQPVSSPGFSNVEAPVNSFAPPQDNVNQYSPTSTPITNQATPGYNNNYGNFQNTQNTTSMPVNNTPPAYGQPATPSLPFMDPQTGVNITTPQPEQVEANQSISNNSNFGNNNFNNNTPYPPYTPPPSDYTPN